VTRRAARPKYQDQPPAGWPGLESSEAPAASRRGFRRLQPRPPDGKWKTAVDDQNLSGELSVEVVWSDDQMIELEALVNVGQWRGQARAYTTRQEVITFSESLVQFAEGGSPTEFVAGSEDGSGFIGLRFYRIDRAGHIAGYVRLASGGLSFDHRPEQVSRLVVEFRVEAWALDEFARKLAPMAHDKSGRAYLVIEAGG